MWSIIVLICIGVIILYDIYCYIKAKTTLSQKIRDWTAAHPLFPFLFGLIIGILAGHWWWPAGSLPFGL